ncbi:MAG: HYR domain-containing protein [Bacteroidota bacterium]
MEKRSFTKNCPSLWKNLFATLVMLLSLTSLIAQSGTGISSVCACDDGTGNVTLNVSFSNFPTTGGPYDVGILYDNDAAGTSIVSVTGVTAGTTTVSFGPLTNVNPAGGTVTIISIVDPGPPPFTVTLDMSTNMAAFTISDPLAVTNTAGSLDQDVNTTAGMCSGVVPDLTGSITTTGGCNVMIAQSPMAGSTFGMACNDTETITLTATDGCGSSIDFTATLTLKDNEDPVVMAGTATSMTVDCPDDTDTPPTLPTVTDNCGGTLAASTPVISDKPMCEGTRTYTYTYSDGCGNDVDWVFTYTVEYEDFTVSAAGSMTVACPDDTDAAPTLPTVTDNCGVTLTPGTPVISTKPMCEGTRTYTYTYTDCEGNSNDWVFTYTVEYEDFTVPAAGSMTVACPDDTDAAPTLPVVTDNCGVTLTPSTPVISNKPMCEGTRTYTYTYTDCEGNSNDWVFTYTVEYEDFTAPAPGSMAVACPDDTDAVPTPPAVTDNCGVTLTPTGPVDSGKPTCEGTRTYTWTYTDCEGNTQDYVFTYTVEYEDFTAPAPGSMTVACPDDTDAVPTPPAVTDNCGVTLTPTGPVDSGKPTCEGTRTYTWTYTDCEGNTQDYVFTYTVEYEDFTIAAPAGSMTVACPDDTDTAPTPPTVTDNCGVTLTPGTPVISNKPNCEGTRTYTYTYTDCEGNSQDWVFTYTVVYQGFTITAAAGSMTVDCPDDTDTAPTLPVVMDNCGNTLTPATPVISMKPACEGTRTYTYTYTDCAGNSRDWVFTYTVDDNIAPVAPDDSGANATVACLADAVAPTFPTGSTSGGSTATLTTNYTSGFGNNAGGTNGVLYFNVTNLTSSDINITALTTLVLGDNGTLAIYRSNTSLASPTWSTATNSTDINDYILVTTEMHGVRMAPFGSFDGGTVSVTLGTPVVIPPGTWAIAIVASTGNGYTGGGSTLNPTEFSDGTLQINVGGAQNSAFSSGSSFNPRGFSGSLTYETGSGSTSNSPGDVTDNCGATISPTGPVVVDTPDPITCEGTRTYTWTYEDCAGNMDTYVYTYTIDYEDFTVPMAGSATVSCPDDTDTAPTPPTVMDNCGNTLTPTGPVASAKPSCGGTRTYTWTYTDCDGNTNDWVFTYTVSPSTLALTCPTDKSAMPDMSQAAADADFVAWLGTVSVMNGCNPSAITNDGGTTAPDVCTGGMKMVTFSVTDDCNSTPVTCTATYTVPAPTLMAAPTGSGNICIGSVVSVDGNASGGSGNYTHAWSIDATSTGTGTLSAMNVETPTFEGTAAGMVVLNYTVTDNTSGCTDMGSININIPVMCDFEFNINDPCVCNNDADVNGDNGTFMELVTITGPSGAALPNGQIWEPTSIIGGFSPSPFNEETIPGPQGATLMAGASTFQWCDPVANPAGCLVYNSPGGIQLTAPAGSYFLVLTHVDDAGYSVVVQGPDADTDGDPTTAEPGNAVLSIDNTCHYPDISILNLPAQVCANDPAFTINGTPVTAGTGVFSGDITFTGGNPPYTPATVSADPVVLTAAADGDGLTDNGDGTATIDPSLLAAGVYHISYVYEGTPAQGTSAPGCFRGVEASFEVLSPIAITGTVTNETCGDGTGAISVSVAPATLTGVTYAWSGGTAPSNTTNNPTGLSAGTYIVTVTADNGCSSAASFNVGSDDGNLSVTGVVVDENCPANNDGSITLTVTGATGTPTYSWAGPSITAANANMQNQTGLASGAYSVTITDGTDCNTIAYFDVDQPTPLVAGIIASTNETCPANDDGTATVNANGGTTPYTYLWSNGAVTPSVTGLMGSASGTMYTVTVTDDENCTTTATVTITEPAALFIIFDSSSNPTCNGGSDGSINISVAGGNAPYFYSWSNGFATQDIAGLPAGTYNVTVTDANNCQASLAGSVILTDPVALTLTATPTDADCAGNSLGDVSLDVANGTAPYTYVLSNGETSGLTNDDPFEFNNTLSAGGYMATVTDANGCSATVGFEIDDPAALEGNISAQQNITCTENGSATVTVSGGSGTYSYDWSDGTMNDVSGTTSTTSTANNLAAGLYTVVVSDDNGTMCDITLSVNITDESVTPYQVFFDVPEQCGFDPIDLSTHLTVSDPNGTNVALSSLSNAFYTLISGSGTLAGTTFTPTGAGLVTIRYTIPDDDPDGADCFVIEEETFSIQLALDPNFTLSAGNPVCVSDGAFALDNASDDPTGSVWTVTMPSGNTVSVAADNDATNNTLTTGQLVLTIDDATGDATLDPLVAGIYSITHKIGVLECQQSYTATLEVLPTVDATISNISVCDDTNNQIDLTAMFTNGTTTLGGVFSFNGAAPTGASINGDILTFATPGDFNVTYSVGNATIGGNCSASANAIVTVVDIILTTSTMPANCAGGSTGSATVTVTSGVAPFTYLWSNGQTTPTATDLDAGGYAVTVTDDNGCSEVAAVVITDPSGIFFTPIGKTDVTCFGGNDGSATFAVGGGTPGYTIANIIGPNGTPPGAPVGQPISNNSTIGNLAAGQYTFIIADANFCIVTTVVTIIEPTDDIAPMLNCPDPVTLTCGQAVPATLSVAQLLAGMNGSSLSDNCTTDPADFTLTVADVDNGLSICASDGARVISRTYTVIDEAGNSTSCTQTITFEEDTTDPVVTAPVGITLDCDDISSTSSPSATIANFLAAATATDDCSGAGSVSISHDFDMTDLDVCQGGVSTSSFCSAPVRHFANNPESEILLTIENIGNNTIEVSATSATNEEIDFLELQRPGLPPVASSNVVNGAITVQVTDASAPQNFEFNLLWSQQNFGGNWQLLQGGFESTLFNGVCNPTLSNFCQESVTHFAGNAASEIVLTVVNIGNNTIEVSATSATSEEIDFLEVQGPSFPTASSSTVVDGTITVQIPFASAQQDFEFNLLWSQQNFGGNWQLLNGGLASTPFDGTCAGIITVTWTATDDCGNTGTATSTIKVEPDTEAPVVTVPAAITLDCDDISGTSSPAAAIADFLAGAFATDNCSNAVSLTHDFDMTDLDVCFGMPSTSSFCGEMVRHFGNNPESEISLTVQNIGNNTIEVTATSATNSPIDFLQVEGAFPAASSTNVVNGAISVQIPFNAATPEFEFQLLWSLADFGGNWQLIEPGFPLATTQFSGVCNPAVSNFCSETVRHFGGNQESEIVLTVENVGNNTVEITAASATNSPIDFLQVEGAFPTQSSTTAANGEITLQVPFGAPMQDFEFQLLWSLADFGGNWQLIEPGFPLATTPFDGTCSGAGTIMVTWTAVDGCGNMSTATSTITVEPDTDAPMITAPADVTLDLDVNCNTLLPDYTSTPATDGCDNQVDVTQSPLPGTAIAAGTTVVTLTATDDCGNSTDVTFNVVVEDNTDPVALCQDITIILDAMGNASITAADIDNGSYDNCGNVSVAIDITDFTCADLGSNQVTLTVTDDAGNTATCIGNVIVADHTPPTFTCPAPAGGLPTQPWINEIGYDNDGGDQDEFFEIAGPAGFDLSTVTVVLYNGSNGTVYNTIDLSGTIDDEGAGYGAVDTQLPSNGLQNGAPDGIALLVNGTVTQFLSYEGIFTATNGPASGLVSTDIGVSEPGNNPVGESLQNLASGTILSWTGPLAESPGDLNMGQIIMDEPAIIEVQGCDGLVPDLVSLITDEADNCGTVTLTQNPVAGVSIGGAGNQVDVVVTATDASGNVSSCIIPVEVVDDEDPVFQNCPGPITVGNDPDECGAFVVWSAPVALDACTVLGAGSVVQTAGPTSGTFIAVGTYTITYVATDDDGNTATCTFTLTVEDTEAPEFITTIPVDITVECDAVPAPFVVDPATQTTDNCTDPADIVVDFTIDIIDQVCANTFTEVRTWTITDEAGNSATHIQNVRVQDTTNPVAVCTDFTLVLGLDGMGSVTPDLIDNGSTDNCTASADLMLALDRMDFDCNDVGDQVVTLTVTDECGNASSCTAIVTVVENPTIPCTPAYSAMASDPCVCKNNATNLDDGQFDELIAITAPLADTWTVVSSTGLFLSSSAAPPATPTPIANGTVLTFNGANNTYELEGIHVDAQGYTVTVQSTNFGTTFTLSNTCFYPTPEFANLPIEFCLGTNVTLDVQDANGSVGTTQFFVDGNPLPGGVFDASQFGIGSYLLTATFDAGDAANFVSVGVNGGAAVVVVDPDPNNPPTFVGSLTEAQADAGCETTIETFIVVVETPTQLTCNAQVNLSLDETCTAVVMPDMILEGTYGCFDDYEVTLELPDGTVLPGAVVTQAQIGLNLTAIVTHTISGATCHGNILIEDKLVPEFDCPADVTIACSGDADPMLTGSPVVTSCEISTTITFNDVFTDLGECSDPRAIIERTWSVTDESDNTATCVQIITIAGVDLADVSFPADVAIDCACNENDVWQNTDPSNPCTFTTNPAIVGMLVTGEPDIDGLEITNSGLCMASINMSDEIYDICDGSYEVVRTWKVRNMCLPIGPDNPVVSFQIIKVLDTTGPEIDTPDDITVSVSTNSCDINLSIPAANVTDNCASFDVVTNTPFGTLNSNGGFIGQPLGLGTFTVTYVATDGCGNVSIEDFNITVVDNEAPFAICDGFTVAAIGSDGNALLSASSVDDGSFDYCGPVTMEVRKMTDACGIPSNLSFGPQVSFCCAEVGTSVMVEFRVTDQAGNTNSCMVEVSVQDKLDPVIICPTNKTVDCTEDYIDDIVVGQPLPTSVTDATGVAIGTDNCGAPTVTSNVISNNIDCGAGTVTVVFTATDGFNNSTSCIQIITVENSDVFTITDTECRTFLPLGPIGSPHSLQDDVEWPCDIELGTCGLGLTPDDLAANGNINPITGQPINLDARPTVLEANCSDIAVTFDDTVLDFGAQDACLKVLRKWIIIDWCQADANQDPTQVGPGVWHFTQVIKVVNSSAPVITSFNGPTTVENFDPDCGAATATFNITTDDDCTEAADLDITWEFSTGTTGSGLSATDNFVNNPFGSLNQGGYSITFTVNDQCGNETEFVHQFEVVDAKQPSPVCIFGIASVIMPSSGSVTILAEDFESGSSYDNCTPYEQLLFTFSPVVPGQPLDDEMVIECFDIPANGLVPVTLYVTDQAGNFDFCSTFISVQDPNAACPPTAGLIYGKIENEEQESIEEVTVNLTDQSGIVAPPIVTTASGIFQFGMEYDDYDVTPEKDINYLNGVTTYDLVVIAKHILGIELLDSPYKWIAADVNNSLSISTLDIVKLRALILYIDTELADNTSWRFVDSDYIFTTNNPLTENFPEVISLSANNIDPANFIAVKIGDVNASASPNSLLGSTTRTFDGKLALQLAAERVAEGDEFTVDFRAKDFNNIAGYQFTFGFDSSVDFVDVTTNLSGLSTENFGLTRLDEGVITTSWNSSEGVTLDDDAVLFSMTFRANQELTTEEVFTINSRYTEAEAYAATASGSDLFDVTLEFNGAEVASEFELYQNTPNPFKAETVIGFNLPKAGEITLKIYDVSGRVLKLVQMDAAKGFNSVIVNRAELDATGVLYYQLDTDDDTATKKMIIVD